MDLPSIVVEAFLGGIMKTIFYLIGALLLSLGVVGNASAQGFVLVDEAKSSFGAEGGAVYGKTLLAGFSAGAFHSYEFDKRSIDTEAYGILGTTLGPDWMFLGHFGGGVSKDGGATTASARSILVLMQTVPVAFRTQVFAMWTPTLGSVFVQERAGLSIRLGEGDYRIFPHLTLDVNIADGGRSIDKSVSPGCTMFVFF